MEARALNNLLCYYTENDVSTKVTGRPRGRAEEVVRRYSSKKVFLKILQISQESNCVGVSF